MKNRGLTLIEVLTAVAIIGMVIIAVTGFINAGIKTSSRVNVEANLQKEAQTGLNQVADWVMSANHGIVVYGPYGSYYDQAVCIYHDGKNSEDRYVQILFYRKADCKVYYFKNQVTSSFYGTQMDVQKVASGLELSHNWDRNIFCQYVEDFNMDISNMAKRYVELKLVLKLEDIVYNNQQKKIMLRNEPIANPIEYK